MADPRVRFLAGTNEDDVVDVVHLLDAPTIRITGNVTTWRHQVLLYVLVDLLGRIFPRIDVAVDASVPAAAHLPPGPTTVGGRVALIRERSPLTPLRPNTPTITVHIGEGDTPADLYTDASEWQSYLGRWPSRLLPPRRDTAIGPLVAAAHAGARIYSTLLATIIEQRPSNDEIYFSALTYRTAVDPLTDPAPPEIGPLEALLIGAGSVGGAAIYAFAYEPRLRGRLDACDPQPLDDTNPYRAILATAEAAKCESLKSDEVHTALTHHPDLIVRAMSMTITDWEATHPDPPVLPLVLAAVDTRDARELIQDALPLEVINAAVDADLVAVSGHRTGSGPCMCCLHMPQVLDADAIKNRLIADSTGLPPAKVNLLRVRRTPLEDRLLRQIENHRRLTSGALAHHVGSTLDDLYTAEILYGETVAKAPGGTAVAVASPFVTAVAGFLLAGEALKHGTPSLEALALGPTGPAIQYRENPYTPEHGLLDAHIPRSELCLCRSVRRLRLTADLHGLSMSAFTT